MLRTILFVDNKLGIWEVKKSFHSLSVWLEYHLLDAVKCRVSDMMIRIDNRVFVTVDKFLYEWDITSYNPKLVKLIEKRVKCVSFKKNKSKYLLYEIYKCGMIRENSKLYFIDHRGLTEVMSGKLYKSISFDMSDNCIAITTDGNLVIISDDGTSNIITHDKPIVDFKRINSEMYKAVQNDGRSVLFNRSLSIMEDDYKNTSYVPKQGEAYVIGKDFDICKTEKYNNIVLFGTTLYYMNNSFDDVISTGVVKAVVYKDEVYYIHKNHIYSETYFRCNYLSCGIPDVIDFIIEYDSHVVLTKSDGIMYRIKQFGCSCLESCIV